MPGDIPGLYTSKRRKKDNKPLKSESKIIFRPDCAQSKNTILLARECILGCILMTVPGDIPVIYSVLKPWGSKTTILY